MFENVGMGSETNSGLTSETKPTSEPLIVEATRSAPTRYNYVQVTTTRILEKEIRS